jgi:hypothetical protein
MSFAALAIDVGGWRYQQRLQQTAADSAALAGATEMVYSSVPTSISTAAQTDAATNGFTNGYSNVNVTVNTPPANGAYAGNTNAVEVIVSEPQPVHFGLFGQMVPVSARAVATLSTANRSCIYALDSNNNAAITLDGGTINMPQCGMISDGGLLFNGSGTVNAASIGYAGSSATLNGTTFPGAAPKPAVAAADPCPTVAGCAYLTNNPPTSGSCITPTTINGGDVTMSPGKYCGQVIFNNTGSVTFDPGVYDFEGGFNTNGGVTALNGSGVTFYVDGGSPVTIGAGVQTNLSAPVSDNTAGVLYYQPATNTGTLTLNDMSGGNWAGMTYLPGAKMIVDGGQITNSLLLVANDLIFNSTTAIDVPTAAFPGYGGHAVLAE